MSPLPFIMSKLSLNETDEVHPNPVYSRQSKSRINVNNIASTHDSVNDRTGLVVSERKSTPDFERNENYQPEPDLVDSSDDEDDEDEEEVFDPKQEVLASITAALLNTINDGEVFPEIISEKRRKVWDKLLNLNSPKISNLVNRDVVETAQKKILMSDMEKKCKEALKNKPNVGKTFHLGAIMYPLSRHCPFLSKDARDCCSEHELEDDRLFNGERKVMAYKLRARNHLKCPVELCEHCSQHFPGKTASVSEQNPFLGSDYDVVSTTDIESQMHRTPYPFSGATSLEQKGSPEQKRPPNLTPQEDLHGTSPPESPMPSSFCGKVKGIWNGSLPMLDAVVGEKGFSKRASNVTRAFADPEIGVLQEAREMMEKVSETSGSLGKLVNFMIEMLQSIHLAYDALKMKLSKHPGYLFAVLFGVLIITQIGVCTFAYKSTEILMALGVLVKMGVSSVFATVKDLWERADSYSVGIPMYSNSPESKNKGVNVVSQMSENASSSFIATLLMLALPDSRRDAKSFIVALTKSAGVSKGISTASDGLKWVVQFLPAVIGEFTAEVFGLSPDVEIDDSFRDSLVQANTLNARYRTDGSLVLNDLAFCNKALCLYETIKVEAPKNLAHLTKTSSARHLVDVVIRDMEHYIAQAKEALGNETSRIVPFGVYMQGEPGIGKSTLLDYLGMATFPDVPTNACMYGRNFSDQYWSKYLQQPFVFVDDYGASTTATGQEFTAEIMQLISSTPYGLNMAGVAEKGTTFRSKVVMLTSNKPLDHTHLGISDQGAFMRRFLSLKAKLNPKYATNGMMDPDKMAMMTEEQKIRCDNIVFDRYEQFYDPQSGLRTQRLSNDQNMSAVDVAILIRAGVLNREREFKNKTTYAKEFVELVNETVMESQMGATDETFVAQKQRKNRKSKQRQKKRFLCSSTVNEVETSSAESASSAAYDTPTYVEEPDEEDFKHDDPTITADLNSARQTCHAAPPNAPPNKKYEEISRLHAFKTMVASNYEDMMESIDDMLPFHIPDLVKILGIIAGVGAVFAMGKDLKDRFSKEAVELEKLDSQSKPRKPLDHRKRGTRNYTPNHIVRNPSIMESQISSALDSRREEENRKQAGMYKRIYDNGVTLATSRGTMNGVMIQNNILFTNRHFFLKPNSDGSKAVYLDRGERFSVGMGTDMVFTETFNPENLHTFSSKPFQQGSATLDLCLYVLKGSSIVYPSILKYFVTQYDIDKLSSLDEAYFVKPCQEEPEERFNVLHDVSLCHERQVWSSVKCREVDTYVSEYVTYSAQTKGDCGSMLLIPTSGPRKIMSIHIAARTSAGETVGMGCLVTKELLVKLLNSVNETPEGLPQTEMSIQEAVEGDKRTSFDELASKPKELVGSFKYVGRFTGNVGGLASSTKLTPSKIFNCPLIEEQAKGKQRYEPAVLGNDPRCPGLTPVQVALKVVSKGGTTARDLPARPLYAARLDITEQFIGLTTDESKDILTIHEAINGSDKFPNLGPLNMSSSEGFPYTLNRPEGCSNKSWMFDDDVTGNRKITNEQLALDILEYDGMLKEGKRPPFIFTYCLKDELRPLKKIESASTRVICAAPVSNTILMRMYFGAFISFFHGVHVQSLSAIGMNIYSPSWDALIRKLLRISPVGFDGDYEKFEKYFNRQIGNAIHDVIEQWYGSKNQEEVNARFTLMMGLVYTYCRLGPHLFMTYFGNPSGNVLTGIINCIMNALLMRVAWQHLAIDSGNDELQFMHYYNKLVAEIYWGDDHMHSVHEKASFFNCGAVGDYFAFFDIVYTPANKISARSNKNVSILELEFTKCTTVVLKEPLIAGMKYYPVALHDSLCKSLCYVSSKLDPWEATETNIDDCLRRALCSGPLIFNQFRNACIEELRKKGSGFVPITFFGAVDMLNRGQLENFTLPREKLSLMDKLVFIGPRIRTAAPKSAKSKFAPSVLIDSQMDDGGVTTDTSPADIQAPVAATVVAPPSTSLGPIEKKMYHKSCKDIIKRYGVFVTNETDLIEIINNLNPARALSPWNNPVNSPRTVVRHISWWSSLYRFYKGSMRFKMFSSMDIVFSYGNSNTNGAARTIAGLSVPASLPAGNNSGGWIPLNATRRDVGLIEVQTPFVSPYGMLKIPKRQADLQASVNEFQAGSVGIFSATGADVSDKIYAACGDDMRFSYVMGVPALRVVNSLSTSHTGNLVIDIPEFYNITNQGPTGTSPITQDMLLRWSATTGVSTRLQNVNQLTVLTSTMTNDDLRALGIVIGHNQVRNYLPGVTTNISGINLFGILLINEGHLLDTLTAGPAITFSDGVPMANAFPTGNINIVQDGAGHTTAFCDELLFTKGALASSEFQDYVGVPINSLVAPLLATTFEVLGKTGNAFNFAGDSGIVPITNQGLGGDGICIRSEMDDSATGVSFSDTTATLPTVGGRGVNLVHDDTKNDMSEQQIDYVTLIERFQWTDTVVWNTNQGVSTVLASYRVPWDLLKSNSNRSPFQQFSFWKGITRIKLQMQSNMFQGGSVVAAFFPVTSFDELLANGSISNRIAMTAVPHVIMQAGASRNATLDIPFVHWLERLNPTDANSTSLGTLVISVFNRLRTGDSATGTALEAKISMFASFPESKFQVVAPTKVDIVSQGGAISSLGNNVANVVTKTIDFADKNKDVIAAVGALGGLDRPNVGVNTQQMVIKKYPDLATACNVEQAQVLALYPDRNTELTVERVGCTEDEMSFAHLRSIKTLYGSYQWSASNVTGDVLCSGLLVPTPSAITAPLNSVYYPTMLEYTTLPFALWRGGLKYTIQIVGSKIPTGRIAFCTHIGSTALAVPFIDAMSQYAHIFDFSADQTVFEVTVPWRSNREMLRVPTGDMPNPADYSMGEYSIRVVTPLQVMESISNLVEINVFISAAEDFETDYIGGNGLDFQPFLGTA